MRLINYGVGEICDRLSILALKILHATGDGKHFRDEANALLVQLRSRDKSGKWFEYYAELAAVNAIIWQGEDELRQARAQHVELIADPKELQQLVGTVQIAFRLQAMNDQRAKLIVAINKDTGEHLGDEKVTK